MQQSIEQMLDVQIQQNPALADYRQVMLDFLNKYVSYESMRPQLVRLYTEAFSAAELKEINAFYMTSTGKKTLKMMPEMMAKGALISASLIQSNMSELQAMLAAEEARLQQQPTK
ncbi:MAG: DUF2059 domain-containing protein [Gammaproteobacteria bacterium]|nr:DUF2059 domain-containing protein [Gammaproteobacteria bacterium]